MLRLTIVAALVVVPLAVVLGINSWSGQGRGADFIVKNCYIWTGNKGNPWAEAMAVEKGRIARIGSLPFVEGAAGRSTNVLDLEGKFVAPGFIDSHVHFISGGLQMGKLNLHGARSRLETEQMVRDAAGGTDDGDWILGSGWSNEKWGGQLPDRSWIDQAAGSHPVLLYLFARSFFDDYFELQVWLMRVDGHMGLANTVALRACRIMDAPEQDKPGGTIVRDEHGVPTGLFIDAAMELMLQCVPKPSVKERRAALLRASRHALSRGVTTVVDFGSFFPGTSTEQVWRDFDEVYTWADSVGSMSIRAALFFPLETWQRVAAMVKEKGHFLSSWIRINGVKAFADGSLGSGSARFHEPYADDPSNFGLHVADPNWLAEAVDGAVASGLQVAVHAIGDAANDQVLDLFGTVNAKTQSRARQNRLRVEHAQHLSPGAHLKFSRNSAIASVQPEHLLDDASYAAKKLGEERSRRAYNFRSLLANGTILAMGSDWPVASLDPLQGVQAANKRLPCGWDHAWIPEERISVADALTGFTAAAAYASHWEAMVGSLEGGKMADFVVLSRSPLESRQGHDLVVLATYVGGVEAFAM